MGAGASAIGFKPFCVSQTAWESVGQAQNRGFVSRFLDWHTAVRAIPIRCFEKNLLQSFLSLAAALPKLSLGRESRFIDTV